MGFDLEIVEIDAAEDNAGISWCGHATDAAKGRRCAGRCRGFLPDDGWWIGTPFCPEAILVMRTAVGGEGKVLANGMNCLRGPFRLMAPIMVWQRHNRLWDVVWCVLTVCRDAGGSDFRHSVRQSASPIPSDRNVDVLADVPWSRPGGTRALKDAGSEGGTVRSRQGRFSWGLSPRRWTTGEGCAARVVSSSRRASDVEPAAGYVFDD